MASNHLLVEGFQNNVTLTYSEKILSVVFACKYHPSVLYGDTFENMLKWLKNSRYVNDYSQICKIIQKQGWFNQYLSDDNIYDVLKSDI